MFSRLLSTKLHEFSNFPGIVLSGPRQSGKTTLAQLSFPKHHYLTFDQEITRSFATEDPERFLYTYEHEHGLIIDEFQYVPSLLPYIKIAIDTKKRPGYFILTGSQNFLANQQIAESLAGRICILNLFPLSLQEMQQNNLLPQTIDHSILHGCYPRLYNENLSTTMFYSSYIQTYLERDIRQLVNISDMTIFQRFVQLCAGRCGQELNLSALANEGGISLPTVKSWLSLLEASYIIFRLQPHFQKFHKRLIKTPKLYFFDTGIVCALLGITSTQALAVSPFRAALFENFVIADFYKQYANMGQRSPLYFWRARGGLHEIDCIIDNGVTLTPIEIKSSYTFASRFFDCIAYWNNLAKHKSENSYVVYGGVETQIRKQGNLIGWHDIGTLVAHIT